MATQIPDSPAAVIDHHLAAFSISLDELMKDYTERSVVMGPDGKFEGLKAISGFFQSLLSALPADFIRC
jgi:hypothetical protein